MPLASAKSLFFVAMAVMPLLCIGQQTASVRATVIDPQGAVIYQADVSITGAIGLNGVTGPNGVISLGPIAPGRYEFTAKHDGFRPTTSPILLNAGMNDVTLKLELEPPSAGIHVFETLDPATYADVLHKIQQPGFCEGPFSQGVERYRFLWVPTFEHPVFIEIDARPDGGATLHSKTWRGQGGYGWGTAQPDRKRELSYDEIDDLLLTLADIGFWTLPARVEDQNGITVDGTQWFIEGVRNGSCHVVTRVSSPLTSVFSEYFLGKVAKVKPYYQKQ